MSASTSLPEPGRAAIRNHTKHGRRFSSWQTWLLVAILVIGGLGMLYPFAWLILSAFKTSNDIVRIPPRLLPEPWTLEAFQAVLTHQIGGARLTRAYVNSIVVTVLTVAAVLFTSTLGGYAFARLKFPGREFLFYFVLSTTMVPFLTLLIPLYVIMDRLQLLNTLAGLIVPAIFSSFGIFLCRQFVYGIPVELYDAAKIDGAGDFTIYSHIIVGLMKPVISVLAIFTFRATFNAYLWPLVVIADARNYTLPLALRGMSNTFGAHEYSKLMASSALTLIPPLIVFFIFQRNLVRGIALTGIKG